MTETCNVINLLINYSDVGLVQSSIPHGIGSGMNGLRAWKGEGGCFGKQSERVEGVPQLRVLT